MAATTIGSVRLHSRAGFTTRMVPRTRGAVSGFVVFVLGLWAAFVPFIGPYFNYSFGTDQTWDWTAARGWLEVLPGVAAAVGGFVLLTSASRMTASIGGWVAAAGGAWLIVGRPLADLLNIGSVGAPLSSREGGRALAEIGYFTGTGAVIVLLAGIGIGRLAVVGVRDARPVEDGPRADEGRPVGTTSQAAPTERVTPTESASTPATEPADARTAQRWGDPPSTPSAAR